MKVFIFRWLLGYSLFLLLPGISMAHSPHHVITDVAVSANNGADGQVYILITDQVFRSDLEGFAWKNLVNGLNNQYEFTSIAISPGYQSDRTVFVASAGDGVYRSSDGGDSWAKINRGLDRLDIVRLSVSANYESDQRILAATKSGGVWRSVDGGTSWQLVLTENVRMVEFLETISAETQSILFVGDAAGNIWRSDDNGRLWKIIHEMADGVAISSIGGTADKLYIGSENHGLYLSQNAGISFSPVARFQFFRRHDCHGNELDQAVSDSHITSIEEISNGEKASTVLVTTWYGGIFALSGEDQSWETWDNGLSCDPQADSLSVSHFRRVAVARLDNGQDIYWLAAYDGLFRGVGDDAQWRQLETLPLGLIKGMAVSGGSDQPLSMALATYGGGFYVTDDGGANWTIGNKGLITTRLTGLLFSPNYNEDGVIYAGAIRRLLRSSDYGQSWQRFDLGKVGFGGRVLNKLDSWGVPTGWARSSDSRRSSPVYPTHIVPLAGVSPENVLFATRSHGVMSFAGSTKTVASVWEGTGRLINSLEISPDFKNDKILFASISGEGVIRSDDSGLNWKAVNNGLDFISEWQTTKAGAGSRRNVFIAMSPAFRTDHTVYAGSPAGNGVYVSHDRGESWASLPLPIDQGIFPVLAIALSPEFAVDGTLAVSGKGRGIFRSTDRGQSFTAIGDQLNIANASIEHLKFSPNFTIDRSIVSASDEQLFLSENSGESWEEITRPVRYEDIRDVVRFSGEWKQQTGEDYSAMTETISSAVDSSVQLRFVGGGVRWLGSRGPGYGSAKVYIDDELVGIVDCNSVKPESRQNLFSETMLDFGAHSIEIRPVRGADGLRYGYVGVDAFDVLPPHRSSN